VLVPLLIGSRAQGAWPKVGRAAARPGAAGTRAGREPGMSATSGRAAPIEAYYRTRGGRRRDHLGFHFWAVWGSNLGMGQL
jgi:hypothetical protein